MFFAVWLYLQALISCPLPLLSQAFLLVLQATQAPRWASFHRLYFHPCCWTIVLFSFCTNLFLLVLLPWSFLELHCLYIFYRHFLLHTSLNYSPLLTYYRLVILFVVCPHLTLLDSKNRNSNRGGIWIMVVLQEYRILSSIVSIFRSMKKTTIPQAND